MRVSSNLSVASGIFLPKSQGPCAHWWINTMWHMYALHLIIIACMSMSWGSLTEHGQFIGGYTKKSSSLLSSVPLTAHWLSVRNGASIAPPLYMVKWCWALSFRSCVGNHIFSEFMRTMTMPWPGDTVSQQSSLMPASYILSVYSPIVTPKL